MTPNPIKIACVGDSITQGRYPSKFACLLGGGYTVKDFGHSAKTLLKSGLEDDGTAPFPCSYWDTETFAESKNFAPDLVIIMLGTNDAKSVNWMPGSAEKFTADYLSLIESYRRLPSAPTVFVATSPSAYNQVGNISAACIANEIVPLQRKIAEEAHCPLIDIFTATANAPELFPDGIHPGDDGNSLIAQAMVAGIRKL